MASLADLMNQVPGSKMVVGLGHTHAGASKTISKQEGEQGASGIGQHYAASASNLGSWKTNIFIQTPNSFSCRLPRSLL